MALMEWSKDYSVNITEFDGQHKKIVGFINELHLAMREAKGKEVMGKILDELADYTVFHFSAEERLMHQYSYPGYIKHKAEHDNLTKQVLVLVNDYKAGKSLISQEVMQFLKDWLVNHIIGSDKKYSDFLNSKGIA